jgi:hypothetical protein
LVDRGTHIEVVIARAVLCAPAFVDTVCAAFVRFGAKPLLVVCDGAAESKGLLEAYDIGVKLASVVRARVAIVLEGQAPTDAERLTAVTASNRGRELRSFRDRPAAKAWLAVD